MAIEHVETAVADIGESSREVTVLAIRGTCDTCRDDVVHSYTQGDGRGHFEVVRNPAESGLESGYRLTCPHGHRTGLSVQSLFMRVPDRA